MRRILLNLSLVAFVAAPIAARAGTTDLLNLTETVQVIPGTPVGTTYSFILPDHPTTFSTVFLGSVFEGITLDNVPVSVNGGPATLDQIGFGTTDAGGGLFDFNNENINLFSANFFNDSPTAPAFILGTGIADDGLDTFTYSLTTTTGGSAPEPSSLVLLGTGALGLFGAFRRRFVA